ncbi:MAG: hypothetical protein QW374_06620 [Candidatus Bathyarchaeia archaeon]
MWSSISRSGRRVVADTSRVFLILSLGANTANITEKCRAGSGVAKPYL